MYVNIKDEWESDRCSAEINIEKNGHKVSMSYGSKWMNAFGKIEIKKGESHVWRFRVYQETGNRVAIFIGIMEVNAIRNDLERFFASHKITGGYAFYGWNGTKYYSNEAGSKGGDDYGSSITNDDVIEMKLDMADEETKKLSFKINEVDQGIAFDNFDIEQGVGCRSIACRSEGLGVTW